MGEVATALTSGNTKAGVLKLIDCTRNGHPGRFVPQRGDKVRSVVEATTGKDYSGSFAVEITRPGCIAQLIDDDLSTKRFWVTIEPT